MRKIIKYFLYNPIVGNTLMFFLFIVGFYGLTNLKTTLLPEFDARLITIQLIYPGSSPEEIEEGVITKIEENLKGLDGIERSNSISSENAGLISIEVLKDFDTDLVLRDVKNAVDEINTFPSGMERPVIAKQDYLGFAINFSLSGEVELRKLKEVSREVEKELLNLDGITKVDISGFPEEEIEISFREADLRRYNLSFDEVLAKVRGANLEATGGKIKTEKEELLIRAKNKKYLAEDLEGIIVKTNPNGGNILLHQVANVEDKWEEIPSRSYLNRNPAVVITVNNTLSEDLLEITDLVRAYIVEFNKKNKNVKATVIQDGSEVLNDRINVLTENGVLGFILVVFILALFLNWRLAFWVAIAIPTSFAGMLIFVGYFGVTINLMSLFGMIIVIGILVDDGIVIAENIYQKYEEGLPRMEAALEGTLEVLPAVSAGIITTVVSFSGFFFVDGNIGEFGIELAIVVIISIAFSLVEGALILPAHVSHSNALKNRGQKPNIVLRWFKNWMDFLRDKTYKPLLKFSIDYPLPTVSVCLMALVMTFGAVQGGQIGNTFFPNLPSERFYVNLKLPAGTRVEVTSAVMDRIEKAAEDLNEKYKEEYFGGGKDMFVNIVRNVGPATNQASITIFLSPTENRESITARDLTDELRKKVGPIYEAEFLQFKVPGSFGNPVDISIMGSDYEDLEKATTEIEAALRKRTDLRDVVNNNAKGLKEINLKLTAKAHNLGFTLGEIIRQVRQGFFGGEVQELQRGVDEVKVWLRYAETDRSDISKLSNMRIRSQSGASIPLSELASFSIERGVTNIYHIDGRREVRIEAEIANNNVSVSGVMDDIQGSIVPPIIEKYPSITVGYNGQSREQEKTFTTMKTTTALIIFINFFIILLTFKSISQSMIVLLIVPVGFIGVGLGHYVMDLPLSMVSSLGYIALVGILINDALVFISTFNDKIAAKEPFKEALYNTGISRFRPIVLTSVTTIVGLGPIILERSLGAQLLIPMAVSLAFGLLIITVIILAMIPALLTLTNDIKIAALSIWEGEGIAREEVESALPNRKNNVLIFGLGALFVIFGFLTLIWLAWSLLGVM